MRKILGYQDFSNSSFIGLKTLQLWCGLIAIEAYMQTIIKSANSSLSPELSSILFGLIQFPAGITNKLFRTPHLIFKFSCSNGLSCRQNRSSSSTYNFLFFLRSCTYGRRILLLPARPPES